MLQSLPNWHPIFVHFTVALFSVSVLLYLVSHFSPPGTFGRTIRLAARVNLVLGVLFTVGTLLSGWYAYNTVPHDDASHLVMTTHRNWALIAAAAFGLLALWAARYWLRNQREGRGFVLAAVIAAVPLVMAGHYGGELVYGHGVGVQSLPDADDHVHNGDDHDHDADHEDDHAHDADDHHDDEHEHADDGGHTPDESDDHAH
ncbi:DUF2231 domain-containing protein [Aquisalimonas sp.]|uniref:DUF2231 domain-containing protein n=1 Tax=Aquisalimonas sp. TaxID=1872621 RepID=UPI0025C0D072|nr:DUF2231 domain-containing protein [Aquisalimonas sp.]